VKRIVAQYGKARRIWLMDRGVPTEAVLAEMRAADPPVQVSGRHAEGASDPAGEGACRQALAPGHSSAMYGKTTEKLAFEKKLATSSNRKNADATMGGRVVIRHRPALGATHASGTGRWGQM
jgi:hypothetical protein